MNPQVRRIKALRRFTQTAKRAVGHDPIDAQWAFLREGDLAFIHGEADTMCPFTDEAQRLAWMEDYNAQRAMCDETQCGACHCEWRCNQPKAKAQRTREDRL